MYKRTKGIVPEQFLSWIEIVPKIGFVIVRFS